MKKLESLREYQSEKAIVDAVLKISDIIKKITRTHQPCKQSIGDGDLTHYNRNSQVPIPPPMRTLESYASSFSKQYAISSSNCNRAPIFLWKSYPYEKGYPPTMKSTRCYFKDSNRRRRRMQYVNSRFSTSDC